MVFYIYLNIVMVDW